MNPLYNTGIKLYATAAQVAAWRSRKVQKMLHGQKKAVAIVSRLRKQKAPDGFDVWFHAASLGEFEQARPLIERLRRERPELKMLLTFFSPSGYEVRRFYDKVDAVAYLPFDTPANAKAFLDAAMPKMAIFVKYEFWGNYLQQLKERGIPTYIISAIFRKSQIFFKPYGGMFRKMLKCYDQLFVQDENSRQLLSGIGVDNVVIAGDTRFDRVTDVMRMTIDMPDIEQWAKQGFTLIAGSSWAADEAFYIPYLNDHPEVRAIIAPHEFDGKRLWELQSFIHGRSILLSQCVHGIPADVQVIIVDSFGKLASLYRYGNAALIGGGFGAGIHNINEAAVYGIPVIFGPNHYKFKEAGDLIEKGGGFEYTSADSLKKILDRLIGDKQALTTAGNAAAVYIKDNLGATNRIYDILFKDNL